jgi:sugar diacid utilization regulator
VFAALDQVAAEVTKTYLAAREQHLQRGTRARTRFFHALVSDTFDSELALQKQALALNVQLAAGYRAIALKLIQGKAEAERGAEMLQEAMSAIELPPRTLTHIDNPTTLLVLWPEGGPAAAGLVGQLQAETELRWAGRQRPVVRAGLGSYHPGLHGVSRSYLEAQQAMEIGRRLRPEGGANDYEEVVPYLVMTQNPLLAERYVRHHLGPLLDADRKGGGQHLPTLEAFLAKGSVKDAAEALHLHRHTVIYRLDRLKELLGFDLDDPFVRHRMQLALDLRKLL